MQRIIEKIMESLRAELLNLTFRKSDRCKGFNDGIYTALKIVQEEAKTGGWIPCSERLPNIGESVLLYVYGKVLTGKRADAKLYEKYDIFNLDFGVSESTKRIEAWQPLPEAYKPEEE